MSLCKDKSLRENAGVRKSLVQATIAQDGRIEVAAPGNEPESFSNRVDDAHLELLVELLRPEPLMRNLLRLDLSYSKIVLVFILFWRRGASDTVYHTCTVA